MRKFVVVSIIALLLAAAAGLILRFGLAYGLTGWLAHYHPLRHAHSHLMYFGWGTVGLMACIWHFLPRYTKRPLPRGVNAQMVVTSFVALLSFPAFLPNGYGPTQIGPVALPLGSIVSGLNGLMWIVFALLYIRATRGLNERPLPVRLWDWAILLLMLACSGAFGLVALIVLHHPSVALRQYMLHLFLELVAVGWFMLALLGLLWAGIARQAHVSEHLPVQSLALLLAPTFFLGVSPSLVPASIFWISAVANAGAALLLAFHLRAFWRYRAHLPILAQFGLMMLSVYILIALALLWPGLWRWSAGTQLRVFFLHALLLGWISSALLGLLDEYWFTLTRRWRRVLHASWIAGVSLMALALLGLGLISVVQPFSAITWLRLAAWSSVPLLFAMCVAIYAAWNPRAPVMRDTSGHPARTHAS
jgi:hypothetical protein